MEFGVDIDRYIWFLVVIFFGGNIVVVVGIMIYFVNLVIFKVIFFELLGVCLFFK